MSTFLFALVAGILCGCMILSVAVMAMDLWLRWQEWREKKKKP